MKSKKIPIILLLLSFILTNNSFGQMIVEIGKDTVYCTDPNTTSIPMGLNVNIKNGVEPFRFAWECKVVPNGILKPLTASDILDDSTMVSPILIDPIWLYSENKVKFILHVSDHLNNRAEDSIQVDFSRCVWILGYRVIEIIQGDSIWLDAGTPQGSILAYHWEPSVGLSNPDSSATWCKPEIKTNYFLTAIDTSGCSCSNEIYEIRIIPTNIDSKINSENNINPFQRGSRVYFNNNMNQEALTSIFSLDGKLINQYTTSNDNIDVTQLLTEKGVYIIKISLNGNIGVCKYLKH
jgi:hypothetical protein